MTYQYQEVKKTEENQQEENKQTDLFNYEQQHQEIANAANQDRAQQTKEQQTKEQQTKKNETGYEVNSSEESRKIHNEAMEKLYGVKSQEQKDFNKTLGEAEKITQQKVFNKEEHQQNSEKFFDSLLNEAGKTKQQNVQPNTGLYTQVLFPTLLFRGSLPIADKVNPLLIEHCYKLKKEWKEKGEPNLNRSVKEGWQSRPDIQELPELKDFTECLKDAINFVFKQMKVKENQHMPILDTMWYNVCPKGGYNEVHVHPGAFLSGVYYLKKPENSGDIVLHDPRKGSMAAREPQHIARGSLQEINAKAGDVVIFPGWLEHSVIPNISDEDRISISFNSSWGYKPGHGYMEDFIEDKKEQAKANATKLDRKASDAYG